MIEYGQQAILMCNGLFTSGHTLEQVFVEELAYLRQPVGTPRGGSAQSWFRRTTWSSCVEGWTMGGRASAIGI